MLIRISFVRIIVLSLDILETLKTFMSGSLHISGLMDAIWLWCINAGKWEETYMTKVMHEC